MCDIKVQGYEGPERRSGMTGDMYNTVCKERFQSINEDLSRVEEDTKYLRAKIDNGLSSVPKKINTLLGVFVTLIAAIIASVVLGANQLGKLEGKLDTLSSQVEVQE